MAIIIGRPGVGELIKAIVEVDDSLGFFWVLHTLDQNNSLTYDC